MLKSIKDGEATMETLDLIEQTAKNISDSADCAIGFGAGDMVLSALDGLREDMIHHI